MPLLRPISCSDRIETSIVQRVPKRSRAWGALISVTGLSMPVWRSGEPARIPQWRRLAGSISSRLGVTRARPSARDWLAKNAHLLGTNRDEKSLTLEATPGEGKNRQKRRGYSIGEFSNRAPGGTDIPKPYHGLALPHLPETCNRFSRVSGCQPLTLPLRRWRDEQPPPGTSQEVAEAGRLARGATG